MIWAVMIGSLVFIVLLMIGTVTFLRFYLTRTIGRKHRELEKILETRNIPEQWRRTAGGAASASVVRRRMAGLERYVRTTRLVDSEETRAFLLSELAAVKEEWMVKYAEPLAGNREKNTVLL